MDHTEAKKIFVQKTKNSGQDHGTIQIDNKFSKKTKSLPNLKLSFSENDGFYSKDGSYTKMADILPMKGYEDCSFAKAMHYV